MSQFERIHQEPLVMGGQARIRDTDVTVNDIVRLSLAGSSQAEILEQFPMLDAEDVHQALGFMIKTTIHTISINRSNVLEAITPIISYSEILLERVQFNPPKDAIEEQKFAEFKQGLLEVILFNGQRARVQAKVSNVWRYANLGIFEDLQNESLEYVLSEVLKETQSLLFGIAINTDVQVDKQSVLINSNAISVLVYVLAGADEVTANADLVIKPIENSLTFMVKRELESHVQQYSINNHLHNLMQIAILLLYRLGSELKIQQEDNVVIFEFSLPIVDAPG